MKRHILHKLQVWKKDPHRKPLILNGVRQCGKTYILEQFGQKFFPKFHYYNFEKQKDLEKIFEQNLEPKRILQELEFKQGHAIDVSNDLVIFDEIQACPNALTSLKYFQEELPQLHICSAGSLLGLSLNSSSFPVGKVNFLNMYPLSFNEFLLALGEMQLYELILDCSVDTHIPLMAHQRLWEIMLWYWVVGGLPEVVDIFCQKRENLFSAFQAVRDKQNELLHTYYVDFAKHSGKTNALHIERVWQATPAQLSRAQDDEANRFKFKDIIPGINRYTRLANAIDWLKTAHLIIKVPIIETAEIPLSAYAKESIFKLFMFDVGLLGSMSNIPIKSILENDYGTYKGFFAENFIAQELLAAGHEHLFCWQYHRSEVEFLITLEEDGVIPIEVKSGWITRAKSLQNFVEKYHPSYAVIMSGHELKINDRNKYHHYPLYLAGQFPINQALLNK